MYAESELPSQRVMNGVGIIWYPNQINQNRESKVSSLSHALKTKF